MFTHTHPTVTAAKTQSAKETGFIALAIKQEQAKPVLKLFSAKLNNKKDIFLNSKA